MSLDRGLSGLRSTSFFSHTAPYLREKSNMRIVTAERLNHQKEPALSTKQKHSTSLAQFASSFAIAAADTIVVPCLPTGRLLAMTGTRVN